MKILFKITIVSLLLITTKAYGESPEAHCESDEYKYSLGTDISPWLMDGGSLIYSSLSGNCRLTLEAWKLEFPKAFLDLNKHNKDEGWQRKATGFALYIDTFYKNTDDGWYSGLVFSSFYSELSREGYDAEEGFRSYEIMLRFGYKWNLTPNVSLEPWFAAGPLWTDGNEPTIGGEEFQESKIQMLGTAHLTYSFE